MNRAFVKEDDEDKLTDEELNLPQIDGPVLLTPAGFERLKAELEAAHAEVTRLRGADSPEDKLALARAMRTMRILELRRGAAVVVAPPHHGEHADTVAFGSSVTVEDEAGDEHNYTLVGATEAEPKRGLINVKSPLAEALLGHRVGDTVTWRRPAGETPLTITRIAYPEA
ncbi:MAG: GreA/GreB family elongation factor [Alphaproteobacteria bacterium]